jgi:SpoVK/Ycf46/Vps4 family AAA+-type ATPase
MEKEKTLQSRLKENIYKSVSDHHTAAILSTGRQSRQIDADDSYQTFYRLFPNAGSYGIRMISPSKVSIDHSKIEKHLQDSGWELMRYASKYSIKFRKEIPDFQHWAHASGILIRIEVSQEGTSSRKVYEDILALTKESDSSTIVSDSIEFISPIDTDDNIEKEWEKLKEVVHNSLVEREDDVYMGMISHNGTTYYVKDFNMKKHIPELKQADLHYGDGFEEFHKSLLKKITTESKGLILLHGEPGTGKTQYIRVLLQKIAKMGKSVLYVPPSFSAQLVEPSMIEFISDWILEEEKDCILLIEDAEPLLETRQGSMGRTTGISNLLNMTDGLLNDILGLMVIATFNTEISKIDSALLRPQRLLARKSFSKLPKDRAEKLAAELKIDLPAIEYPASLAEFYTAKKSDSILIHELKEEKTIGFRK